MNQALLQARIWKGYGKAADCLGQSYQFYRSRDANILAENWQPMLTEANDELQLEVGTSPTSITPYQTIMVSLNAEDMKYGKPNKYGHPTWYGVFDGTSAAVGDYLVGATGTYFIAAMQPLLPILLVECNRIVNVLRPAQQSGVGAVSYGGTTAATETLLMDGWPCSILQGTKGEKSDVNLPDNTRTPWWSVLLPYRIGVTLKPSDIISDDLGRRYIISSPELTDLGWRITAALAIT